jgi:hypothetical protein
MIRFSLFVRHHLHAHDSPRFSRHPLHPHGSTGVQGDQRTHSHVVALRAVTSSDGMTADWYPFEQEFLQHVSTKICNSVRGVNRVVYVERSITADCRFDSINCRRSLSHPLTFPSPVRTQLRRHEQATWHDRVGVISTPYSVTFL